MLGGLDIFPPFTRKERRLMAAAGLAFLLINLWFYHQERAFEDQAQYQWQAHHQHRGVKP